MAVLALDTATPRQSVALGARGLLISAECSEAATHHSETLLPAVERVLRSAGMEAAEISAVAVASGPGSFTGLRVGLSTAKGLAVAAGVPVAGFSTLRLLAEALAEQECAPAGTGICALIEAGRGQLYRGLYVVGLGGPGGWLLDEAGGESIASPEAALAGVAPPFIAGGESVHLHAESMGCGLPAGARLAGTLPWLAPLLARRASALLEAGRFPSGPLEPNYIRPPDAIAGKALRR